MSTDQDTNQDGNSTTSNDSGLPGGGVGRREEPGHTGVYPMSAEAGASGSAPLQGEEAWGQGDRGKAGYADSGGSQIIPPDQLGEPVERDEE